MEALSLTRSHCWQGSLSSGLCFHQTYWLPAISGRRVGSIIVSTIDFEQEGTVNHVEKSTDANACCTGSFGL